MSDPAESAVRPTITFPVRLSPEGFWESLGSTPTNPQSLVGAGGIEIAATRVVVRAQRRRPFMPARAAEFGIDRAAISDVVVRGSQVVFTEKGAKLPWTLIAASEADAASITRELPFTKSLEFDATAAAFEDFARRLAELKSRIVVTPILIALNVLVFVAMAFAGAGVFKANPMVHIAWGSNSGPYTMLGEEWRLVTSQFLHFGLLHLALNMWVLAVNGPLAERLFGTARFLTLYLFAGVCASATSLWWHPTVNSAGASGAIFGVLGALLAFALRRDLKVPLELLSAQRNSVLVFVAFNLLNGARLAGVDNAAHLGGLAGGLVLGLALAQPMDVETRRLATLWARVGLPLTAIGLVMAFTGYALKPSPELVQSQRLRRDMLWLVARERPMERVIEEVEYSAGRHEPDRRALLARLTRDVLPFYAEAERRMTADYPVQGRTLAADRAFARKALRQRVEANKLLVSWVRFGRDADRRQYVAAVADLKAVAFAHRREQRRSKLQSTSRESPRSGASIDTATDWFSVEARAIAAVERSIRDARRAGRLTDMQAAERFQRELLPRWAVLETQLEARGPGDPLSTPRLAAARREYASRVQTILDMRAEAWRKGDNDTIDWARQLESNRSVYRRKLDAALAEAVDQGASRKMLTRIEATLSAPRPAPMAAVGKGRATGRTQVAVDNTDVHFQAGRDHAALMEWALAEREFRAALAITPTDPQARFALAKLYQATDRMDAADREWTELLRHAPHHGEAMAERARTRERLGRQGDAVADARHACNEGHRPGCELVAGWTKH